MPSTSRWNIPTPVASIPSFLFTSPTAALSPEPYLIDTQRPHDKFLSLHTFREWSKRFAAGLIDDGLQPGDRVVLISGNSIFYPVIAMGTIIAGGVFSSANPAFTPRELTYHLKNSEASFLFSARANLPVALAGAEQAGLASNQVFLFEDLSPDPTLLHPTIENQGAEATHQSWKKVLATPEAGKNFKWETLTRKNEVDKTVILIYSSGTTGLPKGVELSHYNIVANMCQQRHLFSLDPRFAPSAKSRTLGFLPMYHALGLIYYCFVAPKRQLQVYLMNRYSLQQTLINFERFKIKEQIFVPPIMVDIAKSTDPEDARRKMRSLQKVTVGAAPLGTEAMELFERLLPNPSMRVRQAWGMSETPAITLNWDPSDESTPTSISVGELLPNCEGKIMDDDGITEVPRGSRGEFWCRGPNVMKGYWRNAKATNETLTPDGWLKTGDIAYIDEDDKVYIVDRKKELIKVKGSQVAPAELEAVLLEHPAIADAAVIGIRRDDEEYPRAYVVRLPNANLTEAEVVKFVEARVAKIKRITGGVEFLDAIPKNPSGKILRRQLREKTAADALIREKRSSKI